MSEKTTCVIVGGGPAGMIAGLLLARGGVDVTVLEKHADFLRDFRGDTVHPSTLRLLDELGLFEQFDALPHTKLSGWGLDLPDGRKAPVIDFTRLRLPHRYIAMVPQWDLLDLLAEAARNEPSFTLRMSHDVTGLIYERGRVAGVRYDSPDGPGQLRADLTIACDGRWSLCRREGGLIPREYPVSADIWWFRLPKAEGVGDTLLPRFKDGQFLGVIPRENYLQTAYFLRKGADARLRARGIEALRADIVNAIPELAEAVNSLAMDDVKLLDIRLNRLRRWYTNGLLCIGDAAHAMSPAGGVGINMAVQDAVAAARLLAAPLREHRVTAQDLAAVQRRREFPTAVTQTGQRFLHAAMLRAMNAGTTPAPTRALRILARFPQLAAIPAYLMGVGVRPEHAPQFARRAPQPVSAATDR
ncbi:FAD-dependent oxidoreductase [Mycobacterium cookii]|uniref:Monooxygenase, FAD-binding protein n=1 Tax=Mycobacterium cookii TaxID=1775 RepID=A0A7I7L0N1_9MYCO|nr:FAD-dependent oxidoreductase [Mycobacterium cookii]MCV7329774.1 FAD-dependent oxidoreductase [Mycobacterium cookii]BBX47915.1 monooxygenase, FAD-binding protein [Mycobacterium cookii]